MLNEIDVMKSLKPHPHVVRLIGIKKGTGLLISVCWLLCFHCTLSVKGIEWSHSPLQKREKSGVSVRLKN